MDVKLREDLFKKYAQSLERRLEEEDDGGRQGPTMDGTLLSAAAAWLGAHQADPGQRFRLFRFYELVENSLLTLRGASLHALETAFSILETVCTNLLLFPWKKEFRCIKVGGSEALCPLSVCSQIILVSLKRGCVAGGGLVTACQLWVCRNFCFPRVCVDVHVFSIDVFSS